MPKEGRSNNSGIVSAAPDDQNELVSVGTKADAAKQQLKPIDKGDVDENKENKENKKQRRQLYCVQDCNESEERNEGVLSSCCFYSISLNRRSLVLFVVEQSFLFFMIFITFIISFCIMIANIYIYI